MNLRDFIIDFADNHQVKHLDDLEEGIVKVPIAKDIYLVENNEVTQ